MASSTLNAPDPLVARFEAEALPWLDALYHKALHLTRSPEQAADLVQETCLRAFRTFGNFTEGTNCRAWLFTILYSIFINQYRKGQREPDLVSLDEWEETHQRELADPAWDAEFDGLLGAEQEWQEPEVAGALALLPPDFRAAVLLVDVEQLTYEEAAAVVNCPVGTLRSRLFRARRALFVQLRDYARLRGFLRREKV